LGPYEIVGSLGAGGMGEVYRARDTRLNRDVAVKVLPGHLAQSPQALTRFEREAKAVAALSHPNILALYDVGAEQGTSFAVLELLEGETLRARLERGALSWRKAVEIGAAVADGLAAAHGKGIIHRDLKPENIFLTSDGRVKVLDFGLARVKPASPQQDQACIPTETESGTVLGTVGYMSPEQVRGERADDQSDIFSLGCVIYEMLAGRRPFDRETAAQTMTAILEADPPELAASGNAVPAELTGVVAHCLEKDSRRRFQSANDLAFALRAVHGLEPAAAPSRRRWLPAALWAASALALAGASLYWLNRPGQPIESLAVLPFTNVGEDPNKEYLSDGVTENLINSLSQIPALRVTARSLAFRYKGPHVDPLKAGRDLGVRALLTGRIAEREGALNIQAELLNVADGAQLWGAQFTQKFTDILAIQREIVRAVTEKLRHKQSMEDQRRLARRSTESTEAYQLFLKGRYLWNRRTEQTLKRAVGFFQQAIEKDPGYAAAYAGLADCYAVYNSYQVEPPKESGPKARAAAMKALELDESLAEAHASLGMMRMSYEWDWAGAERAFQRSVELGPDYATARHWYGVLLSVTGRNQQALASLRQALQLDPLSLIINADLGMLLHLARRNDEAIEQVRKVIEMDPNFVPARRNLGMAYEQKAMHAEAIAELQKAVDLAPGNPFTLGPLGHAFASSGNSEKARRVLDDLLELATRRYVPPFERAAIYTGLGEQDRAFDELEKSFNDRSLQMIFLNVDPRLDLLRADPRFAALLRRMGLE
jgi:serine/threonine-protein kinase